MFKIRNPKFTLIGAGPGDPELITLKAVKVLGQAPVVLYDALVDQALLDYINPQTQRVYVGKRAGKHNFPQQEINRLIVEYAFSAGHVVRLKGGDPFVFGRGHEEMEYARAFGIQTELIPGISSALAAPAGQNIPLTRRGISESFWVITGTTRSGAISRDIELAAQSTATVIILMGMHRLAEIMTVFQFYGRGETGAAIIQNATLPNEDAAIATVDTLVEVSKQRQLGSPAVIVVGDVVRETEEFKVPLDLYQTQAKTWIR
ncbi:MAG: uroporphyrinogen-III C-methyltransferase [Bacteroidia bacterium]|nr:uroporphyrinogen-III C-methyltransferase [Bacteroidia bacterium]